MRKLHRVIVNGEEFSARRGDLLLDAALMNGVHIPHDCRSGHCGTCQVRVIDGRVFGGGDPDALRACQSRIVSDVRVAVEAVPDVTATSGRVSALVAVAPDVVEVSIALPRPATYLPGQYFQVRFRGLPARCYSPTVPLDRFGDDRSVRFHVRRLPGGRVSSALGRKIREGHRVKLTGPFGSAYLRPKLTNRLVLVSSGTGFAPAWAIADAAMRENYEREVVLVASAGSIEQLYMIPALWRLATCPCVTIVPVTGAPQRVSPVIRTGRATDYVPELRPDDVVYACGSPPMVEAVRKLAAAHGAICHADPFVPNIGADEGLLSRALNWLTGNAQMLEAAVSDPRRTRSETARKTAPVTWRSPRTPSRADELPMHMRH